MDLQFRALDLTDAPALKDFALERAATLDHLVDRVVDAQMELRRRHQRSGGEATKVQLTIQVGRQLLRAEEEDHDPRRAIDQVVNKMARQIRRYHDKRTDRKGRRTELVVPDTVADDTDDEETSLPALVRSKRFAMKPMHVEDAIDQLELLGHDFYLFQNAEEDQMNVVYRRRDGSYGLLGPERA
ncbi:MAG: ribosome-associated translation inhibitor RaiA [Chloroflexota bacterium]|nr:ribosome-associated translation inhibitor RaiA [Chloroflexota bacterium]